MEMKLTIGRRLHLGIATLLLLVALMCGFTLWVAGDIRRANGQVSRSLEEAGRVQQESAKFAEWMRLLNRTQAEHNESLRRLGEAVLGNEANVSVFLEGKDPLGRFLESEKARTLQEDLPAVSAELLRLEAARQNLLEGERKIVETWRQRHEGLGPALDNLKRTQIYWALNVANNIFIQSSIGELIPDSLEETPLEEFRAGALYLQYSPGFPELVEALDKARPANEKLWRASKELNSLTLGGKWESVRKLYRDVFPPSIKSMAVDLDRVLALEGQILRGQEKALTLLNTEMKGHSLEAAGALAKLQNHLQEILDRQGRKVEERSKDVLERRAEMEREIGQMSGLNLLIAAIVLCLGVSGGIVLARSITRPLGGVVGGLREIAEGGGDLNRTLEVRSTDETGELAENFNRFVARLREMVSRIREVADDLTRAAEQIRSSSREVNEGAWTQSRALEESHQALQGIDEDIAGIAESTGTLVDASRESSSAALELGGTIEEIGVQVAKLFATVEGVSSSAREMAAFSGEVTRNVEVLSTVSEKTSAAIFALDQNIKEIEQSAETAGQMADLASGDALRGKEAVDASMDGIVALSGMIEQAGRVIHDLGHQSKTIGSILTVIDDVADQTGLLSLNAAIIAAQAGEQGKGFAVVADEIRELADRTAVSTREIGDIIKNLQAGAREAVAAMDAGREQVRTEVERARTAGDALEKIMASTGKATENVRGIVRVAHEQGASSRRITESINEVTRMLEKITSNVDQQSKGIRSSARASEEMREIAAQVKRAIGEQTEGSRHIRESMERIRTMVGRIDSATQDQSRRTREVVEAVSSTRVIAQDTASRTGELDKVVEILSRQVAALEAETGAFRVGTRQPENSERALN